MQEKIFEGIFALCAILSIFAVLMICFFLFVNAIPTISQIGFFDFIFGMDWYPTEGIFGIFPMIVGSFYVTALAILIGVPLGVLSAIYLSHFVSKREKKYILPAIELLGAIPSVVYGFFGLVVIVPLLATTFSGIPGKSVLAAALILSIMILPTIILVSKAAIDAFIGPSGCGKSAFIKSLNRMNDLVEDCKIKGKILFDGKNIYKDYDVNVLRKKVGMVFQKPNPFPMSIYDNITFDPKTHGIKKKSKLDEIVESSLRDAVL